MNFLLPEELISFEDSLRQFFTKRITSELIRSSCVEDVEVAPKFNEDLWSELAELGVFAAAISDEHDGLGMGTVSAELILGLSGEFLVPVPMFETLTFGAAVLGAIEGTDHLKELLPSIAAGETRVSAAFEQLFYDEASAVASSNENECEISGNLKLCPSAGLVDTLIVPASVDGENLALYSVSLSDASVKQSRVATLDCLRPYYQVELKGTPAKRLSADTLDEKSLTLIRDIISLCSAAEMTGAAKRSLSMSVEYAQTRTQFGKPIGSFQAVAHKLADMHVFVESSEALVRFAAWACDNDETQREAACSAAKAYASKVCPKVAQDAIQAHGGIGFTYEYDLHFFLRRIRTLAASFGTEDVHAQRVAAIRV